MKKTIVTLLLVLTTPALSAATRDLTLGEALTLAHEHSYAVKKAEADRDAAVEALSGARANRFPTLDASAYATYISYVPTLDIQTPLGNLSREVGTHENYQTDLRLVLPLFTGGKISGGINAADAGRRYRDALLSAAHNKLDYFTRVQYLSLYQADRGLTAAREALRRAEITQDDVISMYDAGTADSVDILETDLAVTDARYQVDQAQSNRRAAEISLLQLLGLPAGDTLVLKTAVPKPQEADLTVLLDRPELLAADAAIDLSIAQEKQTKAGYLPSLAIFGGYSYGKPNLDRFNNTWNDYFTAGAKLSWSFNLGFKTSHEVRRAQYSTRAVSNERANLDDQLHEQARLAAEQVRLAFQRYHSALKRHEITTNNYRLAQARHREGVLTSNRLLEIETALSEADAALATAQAGYYIAQSAWYYAIGSDKLTEGL